ncbi:MAG TPA: MBL fold metallo-hydrolase [Xanthobacteraceae bacterium]|nr:MBL fold metallo-hydrolase [Xanthobacteraceae bacterium]
MAANERFRFRNGCLAALMALALPFAASGAAAQINERCPRLVSALPSPLQQVSLRLAQQKTETPVSITFIGHATFLIESPGGIKIATDYNDYVRPDAVPDIATMNRAHSTHYTLSPDPSIKHVLRGWGENESEAKHELSLGDVYVRNVPTNIRDWQGGTIFGQNSIFVFEIGGLCIAHLGHLHHTLTAAHLDALGRIDVVLVPVDGSFTLNTDGMVEVLKQIDAPVAIPMHMFGEVTLQRFLQKMGKIYEVQRSPSRNFMLSRSTMPRGRTMIVLQGR